jgi:hypothetical protein
MFIRLSEIEQIEEIPFIFSPNYLYFSLFHFIKIYTKL